MSNTVRSSMDQGPRDLSGKTFRLFLCLNLLIMTLSLGFPSFQAEAATIYVNTTDDELNSDGDCSLREAIQAANTNIAVDACAAGDTGQDWIIVPAGTYVLSLLGKMEDGNTTGDLDVTEDLIIQGATMDTSIFEGDTGWDDRIVDVISGGGVYPDLTLWNVTLRYGNVDDPGGGVRFQGDHLQLQGVRINDNHSTGNGGGVYVDSVIYTDIADSFIHDNSCIVAGCDGGGVYSTMSLSIQTSEIYQNSAQNEGGGLYLGGITEGIVLIDTAIRSNQADSGGGISSPKMVSFESEISNNSAIVTANGTGGGIYHWGISDVQLYNTTISGNQANADGGGLSMVGTGSAWIKNVTFTDNEANADSVGTDYGGGIYFDSSPSVINIANTIIAENLIAGVVNADHADCTSDGGTLNTDGWNLQGLQSSTKACDFNNTGDMQGTVSTPLDPLLGSLQDNGGPTNTHALLNGSPAIENGNPAAPGATWPLCLTEDQRGVSRPQDTYCDIGAFEKLPNGAPNMPSNPIPADSAGNVSVQMNLIWDGGDPDGDPVTYDVYFEAGDPDPDVLLCDDISETTCDPGTMLLGTTYYWGVVADDGEDIAAGPIWSFTTSASAPAELLLNTDLEVVVPSPWKGSNLETVDGSDCATAHGGTCSAALTGTSGPTKMLFYGLPGFSGSAGDTFNLSYYNRRQDVGGAGAVQVRVSLRYTDATMGHFSYVPGVGTADWELLSHDFTAAKNYDWGVVRLIFSKPNGTLWYDDMSLMRNGSEELLDNGDMEIRVPSMWKGAKLTLADGADCAEASSGICSATLTGTSGETKMLFYGIPGFSGSAGDVFTLSYYNKRDSVGGAGAVQVRVSIRYTDASMGHFSFVPGVGTAPWDQFIHEFTAAKDYDWGVVRLIFSKPNGTLWYDEIRLTR